MLRELESKSDRSANFKTVIARNLNEKQELFTGKIFGEITFEKKGTNGFGYDPVFQPEGFFDTFAQLSFEEKGQISHRAKAVAQLIAYLKK